MSSPNTTIVPPVDELPSLEWCELFYITSYNDSDALDNPNLSPRGRKRSGPHHSYEGAMAIGFHQLVEETATHFAIDKVFAKVRK